MKYPDEIIRYIESQFWFNSFKSNVLDRIEKRVLGGSLGEYTIIAAFNWADTKQGEAYWHDVNKQYLKWYKS